MSLEETLAKLEKRIEEAAARLKSLTAERRTLAEHLEELEKQVSSQQAEIERLRRAEADIEATEEEKRALRSEIEALRKGRAEADAELSRLRGERQSISKRVETLLARLDKIELE